MSLHRVAITGIGIVSSLGTSLDSVSAALRGGESGIVVDPERIEVGFRSPLTGQIRNFDGKAGLSRKQRKTMTDFGVWAYAATRDALDTAGLEDEQLRNPQTGLLFGCDSSCIAAIEQTDQVRRAGETAGIKSGLIFRSMTSTVTMNLNTLLGTQGASWSLSSACSSGGHAIGQAADLIALGRQERVICGAAQEINWESMCSFDAIGAFSRRIDSPAQACRPFDAERDGLVPSGGAAAVILERYDIATARGATILGEVLSYSFSSDGSHLSVPSGEGLERAMTDAVQRAGLELREIDYLCAHATSTPAGDAAEARAIKNVFGEKQPHVSSLKSMTGHELWMSGASQVVYSALMARDGFIAPNLNFVAGDADTEGLNIVRETLPFPPRKVLCNSAGFGGTNSCLILDLSQ